MEKTAAAAIRLGCRILVGLICRGRQPARLVEEEIPDPHLRRPVAGAVGEFVKLGAREASRQRSLRRPGEEGVCGSREHGFKLKRAAVGIEVQPAVEIEHEVGSLGAVGRAVVGPHHGEANIDPLAVEHAVGVVVDFGRDARIINPEKRHLADGHLRLNRHVGGGGVGIDVEGLASRVGRHQARQIRVGHHARTVGVVAEAVVGLVCVDPYQRRLGDRRVTNELTAVDHHMNGVGIVGRCGDAPLEIRHRDLVAIDR